MREPREIPVVECLELLSSGVVGRIALSTPVGPRIVPLSYVLYGDSIVIRTAPYNELGTYGPGNEAAFEVDNLDLDRQQGWSVVVVGRLEPLELDEVRDLRQVWEPRPWAAGSRNLYLALRWREITGRRLGGNGSDFSPGPVRSVL